MNLHTLLKKRKENKNPVRVGLIGAGKFGSMFLSQVRRMPGMHLLGVAELSNEISRQAMKTTGWPEESFESNSFSEALKKGGAFLTEDPQSLISADGIEVIIDATGNPALGIKNVLDCCYHRKHIVMVNVEADALAGPLLARKAQEAGIIYSLAYGDQPALICEQVDWARACGFNVVCAGKGTLYMPEFHASTPETIWNYYGISPERAKESGLNPKMFNSFLDGTKSGIEMAAVANATGLNPPSDGLLFPPCETGEICKTLIPRADGGILEEKGQVEVISSCNRNGKEIRDDLRWGVYVSFEAPSDYVENCFSDYGLLTDDSGHYSALWRPYHLIGLELGISPASIALRNEATGKPTGFRADVVCVAKSDLSEGTMLDGEGGATVWGKVIPAVKSLEMKALPMGLAQGVKLKNPIQKGDIVGWTDVEFDDTKEDVRFRREMESLFIEEKG